MVTTEVPLKEDSWNDVKVNPLEDLPIATEDRVLGGMAAVTVPLQKDAVTLMLILHTCFDTVICFALQACQLLSCEKLKRILMTDLFSK